MKNPSNCTKSGKWGNEAATMTEPDSLGKPNQTEIADIDGNHLMTFLLFQDPVNQERLWNCKVSCGKRPTRVSNCHVNFLFTPMFTFEFTGLLMLNVTWKGKTYMGTLLDCQRPSEDHKWGPPGWVSPTIFDKTTFKQSGLSLKTPFQAMKLRFDTTFQLAMHFLTTQTTFSSRSN